MKILSAAQLALADQATVKNQSISSLELMERVSTLVFNKIHERLNGAPVPIKIFCGIGNNGGDGLAVARHMIQHGYHVTVFITNCSKKRSPAFLANYDRIKEVTNDWPVLLSCEEDFPQLDNQDIIIDAIFGTGINRKVDGWMAQLFEYVNSLPVFTLSLDMPSGLYSEIAHDEDDAIIKADHTFTFQTPKLSFFLPETAAYAGTYEVINIGLDPEFMMQAQPLAQLINKEGAQRIYKPRSPHSYKGDYGHVLSLAGSTGKMGAAVLTAGAAINSGAGKVTAYVPQSGNIIMQSSLPEVMTIQDTGTNFIEDFIHNLQDVTLCIGPGLGTNDDTVSAFAKALKSQSSPLIIDADGINILAIKPDLLAHLPKMSILTPHDGELKKLLGDWTDSYDKLEKAKEFSKKYECIIVLKGFNSMTITGDNIYINSTGNPGMATAGSGDVLTGIIASLVAQKYEPLMAAIFGTYIHGASGDLAVQTYAHEGLKASIISNFIGAAILQLFRAPDQSQPA